jgi:hypothetical protein
MSKRKKETAAEHAAFMARVHRYMAVWWAEQHALAQTDPAAAAARAGAFLALFDPPKKVRP